MPQLSIIIPFGASKGFNADSLSHNEKYWNHNLTPSQISQTKEYIKHTLAGGLETQGKRKGAFRLLKNLGFKINA